MSPGSEIADKLFDPMRATLPIFLALCLATTAARADLTADVRRLIADDKAIAKATTGVQVVRLGATPEQDAVLVAIDADKPLIPASNLKVITTAAALDALGSDFRFKTRFLSDGRDVALVGDGDPSFGDEEFLAPRGWTMLTVFEGWAAELKRQGVTRVNDVRVDDSIFEQTAFHPSWPTNQAHLPYEAQVSGVNFNANCLDVYTVRRSDGTAVGRTEPPTDYVRLQGTLTVGSTHAPFLSRELGTNNVVLRGPINATNRKAYRVTIDDPALYAATVLAETLKRNGVEVAGSVTRDRTLRAATTQPAASWRVVAVNETPLIDVLDRTNKESINLYAESIGKRAAAQRTGESGSWKSMAETHGALMASLGVPADQYRFDDGSGLSKQNAVAPAAFCATLRHLFHGPHRAAYVHSMAVGGVDGTLDNRFADNSIRGRVFAKSGTVNNVSALSGYLQGRDGTWYAFSILMNKTVGNRAAQGVQDRIVRAVDDAGGG